MTELFIGVALLCILTAYTFYQIGYRSGEMDGYINAVEDGRDEGECSNT
jgi:hypothetical protein